MVLFDEFCRWCAERHHAAEGQDDEAEDASRKQSELSGMMKPEKPNLLIQEPDATAELMHSSQDLLASMRACEDPSTLRFALQYLAPTALGLALDLPHSYARCESSRRPSVGSAREGIKSLAASEGPLKAQLDRKAQFPPARQLSNSKPVAAPAAAAAASEAQYELAQIPSFAQIKQRNDDNQACAVPSDPCVAANRAHASCLAEHGPKFTSLV